MDYWKDKVVLVTGAASGVGQATAIRFAKEGASVALTDRDKKGLDHTQQRIGDDSRVISLMADLQDEKRVKNAVTLAFDWKRRLDVAVNVAGIGPSREFLEETKEQWDELIQSNLRGSFLVAQEAARFMARKGGGAIVNTSSVLALVGDAALVSYSATKGGVSAMTRAMAVRLGKDRIRVNAVCPGDVATPMLEQYIAEQPDPGAARAEINRQYPLGHFCNPEDVAAAILFLAGPDARCITGVNLVVDCGLLAKCY